MSQLLPFTPHLVSPEDSTNWERYLGLRYSILRKPWGQSRQSTTDAGEDRSLHLLIVDHDQEAVACGRLEIIDASQAKIRSMAVREDAQGQGWGRIIIEHLEALAVERGLKELILDAREPAVGFYLKLGYRDLGPSYLLFGLIPHRKMGKQLYQV
ncbi:MAG: GNAT family N-acetyltransferase [Candidatus Pollutiaquabacter aromativorans]|jgi:predicted GNAT family N-acyltransferase